MLLNAYPCPTFNYRVYDATGARHCQVKIAKKKYRFAIDTFRLVCLRTGNFPT
jgi:hypothetical protein